MFNGLNTIVTRTVLATEIKKSIDQNSNVTTNAGKRRLDENGLGNFLIELHNLFRAHFNKNRHPVPLFNFDWHRSDDDGTFAHFSPSEWSVAVNPRLVNLRDGMSRLATAAVARAIYHEMRHAEQYCLMIRYAWTINRGSSPVSLQKWSLTPTGGLPPPLTTITSLQNFTLDPKRNISPKDYEFAGKIFQSVNRTVCEVYVSSANTIVQDVRDVNEIAAVNIEQQNALIYANRVHEELTRWNMAKPGDFIFQMIETSLPEGNDLVAYRFGPWSGNYWVTGRRYLSARRERALEKLDETYQAYRNVLLEADAHDVEDAFGTVFKLNVRRARQVGQAAGVLRANFLPEPTWW